jgi:type III secretory pathway lipoprotein EscJ
VASDKERDPDSEGHWRVEVARDDASSAAAVLAAESLPPVASPGVLDTLAQGSIVPSRLSEQAKLTVGIAGELERSLRALDGVVSVRVHLAVPPRDALEPTEQLQAPSASVLLRHRGPTPPLAPSEIQRLVAGAVPGLALRDIAVVSASVPALARLPEKELARFGPVTVTRASMSALRWTVGAALLLNFALLSALLALRARLRKVETQLTEARGDSAPAR